MGSSVIGHSSSVKEETLMTVSVKEETLMTVN